MGLYNSELDINKSDSEILSSLSVALPPSSVIKSEYESENGEETDWPSSIPEDTDDQGGEDENEEALEDLPLTTKVDDEKPAFILSRADLRKMQEALTLQEGDAEHPNHMDLRVGQITHIVQLDEYMYISEVDLGEYDESRLVGTNLREYYNKEDLLNRLVVILCNVKPMDDKEIRSKTGMLLLATKTKFDDKGEEIGEYVEIAEPFHNTTPGSRIYVEEFPLENPLPTMDEEFFDFVLKDFTTDSNMQVVWRGLPLRIENCPDSNVTVTSLSNTYCKLE